MSDRFFRMLPLALATLATLCGIAAQQIVADPAAQALTKNEADTKDGRPSPDAEFAKLRPEFPNRTDEEIIQTLRRYAHVDSKVGAQGRNWFSERLRRAREQAKGVAAMEALKWAIGYDYELDPSGGFISKPMLPATARLRELLGKDFFSEVRLVYVMETAPPGVHVMPVPDPPLKHMPDEEVELIRRLPTIEILDFTDRIITDRITACLSELPRLSQLSLHHTDISHAGLKRIGSLRQLRELSIHWTKIPAAEMQHLKGLSGLQSLRLWHAEITDAGAAHLERLPQLKELMIDDCGITDAGLKFACGMHQLRSLNIQSNDISDAGLEHLRGLTQLESLDLWGLKISDAGLEHLQGLTRLKKLELFGTRVIGPGLRHLRGMNALQELNLMQTLVGDLGVKHLKELPRLRHLCLRDTKVTDAGLASLKGLTQLEELNLMETKITDAGLANLQGLSELRWLGIYWTKITDAGAQKLKEALPNAVVGASCVGDLYSVFKRQGTFSTCKVELKHPLIVERFHPTAFAQLLKSLAVLQS